MKVAEVHWDDAHVTTSDMSIKKAQRQKPVRTITVAYLVAENSHGVVLATDIYPDDVKNVKIVNFIPWGIITDHYIYEDQEK